MDSPVYRKSSRRPCGDWGSITGSRGGREGVRGTPMPAWKALGEGETWDIVAYVLSVAELGPEVGEHSDT